MKFTELKTRWKSETPDFFKKLRTAAIKLGGSAGAILVAASIPNIIVPQIIIKTASYILIACATLGITAQMAKNDNSTTN